MQTIQQNWKENGFQIIKSMINNTIAFLAYLISGKSKIMLGY